MFCLVKTINDLKRTWFQFNSDFVWKVVLAYISEVKVNGIMPLLDLDTQYFFVCQWWLCVSSLCSMDTGGALPMDSERKAQPMVEVSSQRWVQCWVYSAEAWCRPTLALTRLKPLFAHLTINKVVCLGIWIPTSNLPLNFWVLSYLAWIQFYRYN